MDGNSKEESLREAACNGNLDVVQELVKNGVNVNDQNGVNGWTALHWASKRSHRHVLAYLLSVGADKTVVNNKSETAAQVSDDPAIHHLLQAENVTPNIVKLPITPHYLNHPEWPYTKGPGVVTNGDVDTNRVDSSKRVVTYGQPMYNYALSNSELVLKVRVADCEERDFYEVELDRTSLTYDALLTLMCTELSVDRKYVHKIRKLPDTVLRKDKDVKRLVEMQELELVLSNKFNPSRSYGCVPKTNSQQILY